MKHAETPKPDKNYTLAIICIIAILLIVFMVSSYLNYSKSTYSSTGKAYSAQYPGQTVPKASSKTIIYADASQQYSYIAHQKNQ